MASLLLAGDWLLDLKGVYVHGILYPVLLAACKGVGIGLLGARLLQAGMGALCCWLIYRIGCRSAAPPVGLAAGLLAAAYWPFIVFGGELLATTLVLLLQLVLVHVLLGPVADRPGRGIPPLRASAAGMLLALLVMTRANAILLAPVVGWWVWSARGPRGWRPVAGLAAGMLLMLSPYLVRNQLVQGSPVPFQGGWSLYQGANPGADGTPPPAPGLGVAARGAEGVPGRRHPAGRARRLVHGRGAAVHRRRPGAVARAGVPQAAPVLARPRGAGQRRPAHLRGALPPVPAAAPRHGRGGPAGAAGVGAGRGPAAAGSAPAGRIRPDLAGLGGAVHGERPLPAAGGAFPDPVGGTRRRDPGPGDRGSPGPGAPWRGLPCWRPAPPWPTPGST